MFTIILSYIFMTNYFLINNKTRPVHNLLWSYSLVDEGVN